MLNLVPSLRPSPSQSRSVSPSPSTPGNQAYMLDPTRYRQTAANTASLRSTTVLSSPGASVSPPEPSPTVMWSLHASDYPSAPSPGSNRSSIPPTSPHQPTSFSPSFELSPIVPLFIVASRCRDPFIRRRALNLLLNCRRREGVWDSFGAGMVALQCMKKEEGLPSVSEIPYSIPSPTIRASSDVPEHRRVRAIVVAVKVVDGKIDLAYSMTTGESVREEVVYESRGEVGTSR